MTIEELNTLISTLQEKTVTKLQEIADKDALFNEEKDRVKKCNYRNDLRTLEYELSRLERAKLEAERDLAWEKYDAGIY
jgi:hypothetical protein